MMHEGATVPETFSDKQTAANYEEELLASSCSPADAHFDLVIGYIEDILVEASFQELQEGFMEKHFLEFEDREENKLIYTDIFKEYGRLIEQHIEMELTKKLPEFSMELFLKELSVRKEVPGEVFEMLHTFTDFTAFKEMFLDYKAAKEGRVANLCIEGSLPKT